MLHGTQGAAKLSLVFFKDNGIIIRRASHFKIKVLELDDSLGLYQIAWKMAVVVKFKWGHE